MKDGEANKSVRWPLTKQSIVNTPCTVHIVISSSLLLTDTEAACDYTPGTRCQTDWGGAGHAGRPLCYQTQCCPENGGRRTSPSDDACSAQTHVVLHEFLPLWEGWMDREMMRRNTEPKRRHEGDLLTEKEERNADRRHSDTTYKLIIKFCGLVVYFLHVKTCFIALQAYVLWPWLWYVSVNTVNVPYNSFHSAHKLLSSALPRVDGRGRGLVKMGLRRSPHLTAVLVDMATLAVADRPVAMAPTAASWEAGDHSPPNMRATVLQ